MRHLISAAVCVLLFGIPSHVCMAAGFLCPQFNLGFDPIEGGWVYYAMQHNSCNDCFDVDFVTYVGGLNDEASCIYPGDCSACFTLADTSAIKPPTAQESGHFTDRKLALPVAANFEPNLTGHGTSRKGAINPIGDPMFYKVPVDGSAAEPVYRYLKVFLFEYLPDFAGTPDTAGSIIGLAFECRKPDARSRLYVGGLKKATALRVGSDGTLERVPLKNMLQVQCGVTTMLARVADGDEWFPPRTDQISD